MVIPFIAMLFIGALLVWSFHKRSLKDILNGGRQKIRWERLISGFSLWVIIAAIYLIVDVKLNPDNFDMHVNLTKFIPLIFVAIVFIPFQAGTEEYFFRGYLAQGVAGWTKQPLLAIIIPSVLFGLMHAFNPEVKEYGFWLTMPQYILFGVFFGLVSVLDDGIEMAIGAHAGNNIFSAIFVTTKASALQTPALLLQHKVFPLRDLVLLLFVSILFVVLMSKKYKWNFKVLFEKLENKNTE
jgi:membrane protease YdiL (CAAX protease family)